MSDPQAALIRDIANEAVTTAARRAVRQMRRMPASLSGDDSCLRTAWDEFCVQVQGEESFGWDAYVATVRQCIETALLKTPDNLRRAIWLQTDSASDWLEEHADDDGPLPRDDEGVIDYVYDVVWQLATAEQSARIERYLESRYEMD